MLTVDSLKGSILFLLFVVIVQVKAIAQDLHLDGYSLVVSDSSTIYVPGQFKLSDNVSEPHIYLDGKILLKGNLINNSHSNVFSGIESVPDGDFIMCGNYLQSIEGDYPLEFENLVLNNYRKNLELNNCKIDGILNVDAELDLNNKMLTINNPSPQAIVYKSEFIKSETPPDEGLSKIEWIVGNSSGSFTIPFGTGYDTVADVEMKINIHSVPNPSAGKIVFATYPSIIENKPLPDAVNILPSKATFIADRYWIIDADYPVKPETDIEFKYTDADVDSQSNPFINKDSLKAYRFNSNIFEWNDWSPLCKSIPSEKKVVTGTIDGQNLFSTWLLQNKENQLNYYMPNAFSPNGDGLNDTFGPVFDIIPKSYKLYILDRWKYDIFYTDNPLEKWDGKDYKNILQQSGIYIWIVQAIDEYGNEYSANGHVMLLR